MPRAKPSIFPLSEPAVLDRAPVTQSISTATAVWCMKGKATSMLWESMNTGYRRKKCRTSLKVSELRTFWSLRTEYRAGMTDNPTYMLRMVLGPQEHHIEDYVGAVVGMPSTVSDFETEIDTVTHADGWVHLSVEAVEQLKATKFRFDSAAGANLLARALSNEDSRDDAAMLMLVELGTPIAGARAESRFGRPPGPVIEEQFRRYVENNHWQRVTAWLKAHRDQPPRPPPP